MNSQSTTTQTMRRLLGQIRRSFFMSPRDLGYWMRSACSDALLARLLRECSPREAFEAIYRRRPDPWGSVPSCYHYKQQKYRHLRALIPGRRFSTALDIGCGLGVFTRQLGEVSDQVLGVDISEVAIREATRLAGGAPSVRFERAEFFELQQKPAGSFDLIVLADVLYYVPDLCDERLKAACSLVERLLAPGGILLLANHFFFGFDRPSKLTRRLHDAFRRGNSLEQLIEKRRPFYLASVFAKQPAPSSDSSDGGKIILA